MGWFGDPTPYTGFYPGPTKSNDPSGNGDIFKRGTAEALVREKVPDLKGSRQSKIKYALQLLLQDPFFVENAMELITANSNVVVAYTYWDNGKEGPGFYRKTYDCRGDKKQKPKGLHNAGIRVTFYSNRNAAITSRKMSDKMRTFSTAIEELPPAPRVDEEEEVDDEDFRLTTDEQAAIDAGAREGGNDLDGTDGDEDVDEDVNEDVDEDGGEDGTKTGAKEDA